MSRNLFKKLNNPQSDPQRNPFDLSQRTIYSARAGMCLPTLCLETVKGDTFEIDTTVFNRTHKLLAPAFFRCKQYNHFYFVPYNTLWHNWDQFYTRSTEQYSAAAKGMAYAPSFNLNWFLDELQNNVNVSAMGDMMGYKALPGIDRLMQMLGYGDTSITSTWQSSPDNIATNLFRIAAYNKIWYWYYRDKRHTITATNFTPSVFVKYYNLDDLDCSTFGNSQISDFSRLVYMFCPKYRTWDSDVFTNNYENTQFGDVSVMSSNISRINYDTTGVDASNYTTARIGLSGYQTQRYLTIRNADNSLVNNSPTLFTIPNLFDILALRRAESVQHWRELMLRAGDSSKNRYEAMFGSAPKRDDDVPIYIGGFDVNLNIDDVTSTAFTPDQDGSQHARGLGELAGKGLMVESGKNIKFTAPDFGVLICITTFLPLSEYDGRYISKANTLIEPTDFYIPQYDRLGFEPVTAGEQCLNTMVSRNVVLGYTVRNHYLKTAVDRIYNNFRTNKSLSYWTNPRRDLPNANPNLPNHYRSYYVDPANLNPLFGQYISNLVDSPDLAYDEDNFHCMTYFNITAIRPMSELGLPPM